MIEAKIVADSVNEFGHRITSVLCTFPRYILAELNTHRVFSRNSASSRAIPFKKMVEMVRTNPFIPVAWQEDHKGMQGTTYIDTEIGIAGCINTWKEASYSAIAYASTLRGQEGEGKVVTKQLVNRLLEPFMWHTVLITSTEFENFFDLRCPQYKPFINTADENLLFKSRKDIRQYLFDKGYDFAIEEADKASTLDWLKVNKGQADIHMMFLAEAIWDALNESNPVQLKAGDWHIPWGDKINGVLFSGLSDKLTGDTAIERVIKVSTGMAARTSYTVVGEEKEVSYETLIGIHDKMLVQRPFHASPFEHIAQCMSDSDLDNFGRIEKGKYEEGWCRNYRGWKQYRYIIESSINK